MTVWEQEQNRTQNWLTPSAKIWPRLNHHLESDVFPLSFPESQKVWMKQHKRGPSLTTWEPSQFQFFSLFLWKNWMPKHAETRSSWRAEGCQEKIWKTWPENAWNTFCGVLLFFPSFSGGTSQDSTSAMRLLVIPRQIASTAHLGARYQRSRGFRSLGSDTMWLAQAACPRTHQTSLDSLKVTKHPGFGLTPQIDKIAFQPGPKWVTCGDS